MRCTQLHINCIYNLHADLHLYSCCIYYTMPVLYGLKLLLHAHKGQSLCTIHQNVKDDSAIKLTF